TGCVLDARGGARPDRVEVDDGARGVAHGHSQPPPSDGGRGGARLPWTHDGRPGPGGPRAGRLARAVRGPGHGAHVLRAGARRRRRHAPARRPRPDGTGPGAADHGRRAVGRRRPRGDVRDAPDARDGPRDVRRGRATRGHDVVGPVLEPLRVARRRVARGPPPADRALTAHATRTTTSARSRVAATRSALRWSGPRTHARAASGALPNRTWRRTSRSTRSASSVCRNHVS